MHRIGTVVEQVLDSVQASRGINDSNQEEADLVLAHLSRSSAALGELINSIIVEQQESGTLEHELLVQLQDLRSCVDSMVFEWEHALYLPGLGRTKKHINIAMVSSATSCHSYLSKLWAFLYGTSV